MGRCTMGLPRYNLVLIGAQILLGLIPVHNALNINPLHIQDATATAAGAANVKMDSNSTLASSCQSFLCVRDGSSSSNGVYPWLINNNNARFAYVRTDSEGFATYSYQRFYNGQTLNYYLHFYDEGLFYNGFWVVNDLETGYVETTGRVFIYNSENDYCPEETYNYWYFWQNGDWVYNTGIYLQTC